MARSRVGAGGGVAAALYSLRQGRKAGGSWKLFARMRSRNACKTCALGMGGARGGMVNEAGQFPEVCKKSFQAQAGDMQAPIPEDLFSTTPLAELERRTPAQLEAAGRLAFPLFAGPADRTYRRIGWDEALARAGDAIRAAPPEQFFLYVSGRSSNEAAFLAQLVARAFGTPNIHNCSYYCHQASGVALHQVYGSGTASIALEDVAAAELAIVAGANPASNHPRLITQLVRLRRRGGRVIVCNPLRELGLQRFRLPSDWRSLLFGSTIADLYLQPHVGGDVALFKGLLKGLLERGAMDLEFVAEHTRGWDAVRADVEASTWDELVQSSGVSRTEMDAAVDLCAGARRGIAMWAMGLTHHGHGVDNVLALANLALARGWLGKPGAGLLPIRGHSNVQGIGSVGVTPAVREAFARELEAAYGIPPRAAGQDTLASMTAAHAGRVRAALLLGGNLYGSSPDACWSAEALGRIDTVVYVSTKLNTGHVRGRGRTTLVLPALVRDEEPQWTTQESMFNYVRVSEGGAPSVGGAMRSEVEIVASLAERILPTGRFDWSELRSHDALRGAIARVVPGYAPLGAIQRGGPRAEFQVEGRTFHEPRFNTADGRAVFHPTPIPRMGGEPGTLRLMTIRSEGQFNSVVYEEEDLYRGTTHRDVVLMHEADAARVPAREGDRVCVETEVGALEVTVVLTAIREGSIAMYYPEANMLVPRRTDARSKTPAFKSVVACVRRVSPSRTSASS